MTPEHKQQAAELWATGEKTVRAIADELGLDMRALAKYFERTGQRKGEPAKSAFPVIEGLTAEDCYDEDALWETALRVQGKADKIRAKREAQAIRFDHGPVCLAFLSDVHFGGAGVDYAAVKRDAETIRDTPNMWAIYHGDGTDNWVIGKLAGLQRHQPIPHDDAIRLHRSWLGLLGDKLLAAVPGNHDLWTHKQVGIEYVREQLANPKILYHPFNITFDLWVGAAKWRIKVRHKWKYGSVFNATHPQQVGWERGDDDYDIGVGGHTHIGTYFTPFHRHHKRRWAALTGTYKVYDSWGEECGFASPNDSGCGALIFEEDGYVRDYYQLEKAAQDMRRMVN